MATETVVAEVLEKKITDRIKASRAKNQQTIEAIEREGNMLRDFMAPLGTTAKGKQSIVFGGGNGLTIDIEGKPYGLHKHAVAQAAERLDVPTAYAKKLAYHDEPWARGLIANILNEHSAHTERRRVLVRMVGKEVRGILSDKYRRLDTAMIFGSFMEASNKAGAQIYEAFADDTRAWLDVMLPHAVPVETENNGRVVLGFGARISNSDFGDGKLSLSAYSMQLICLNGMTRDSVISQIHLGREIPDNIMISNDTYQKDSQAQAGLVRDAMASVLDISSIKDQAQLIQRASGILLNDPVMEITNLRQRGVSKGETDKIQKAWIEGSEQNGITGRPSLWKLSQAVNHVANGENERRRRELQDLAGELVFNVKK